MKNMGKGYLNVSLILMPRIFNKFYSTQSHIIYNFVVPIKSSMSSQVCPLGLTTNHPLFLYNKLILFYNLINSYLVYVKLYVHLVLSPVGLTTTINYLYI